MDKQEYREIVGDIRRAYDHKEYDKVLMYAEELDMRRVSDSRVLEMISDSHMAMGDLGTARELLLKAYEKTPMGRKIAYKLSELSIKLGDLDGAVDFYEDFCKMAPHDNDRFLLKYKIGKAGGVGKKDLAKVLAAYCSREVDEKWMTELASLYDELGDKDKCNEVCDDIILWYADGEYVQRALEMKGRNGELTSSQQSKLERMQAAEKEAARKKPEDDLPEMEIINEEREFRPGTIEEDDALTEDDLDSILEEFITIEDATAPPEPVKAEDMAEISYVNVDEPETEVIPIEEIRVAAEEEGNAVEEIQSAKAEAKKAAAIEAVTITPMLDTPEVKEEVMETPAEIQNEPIIEDIELRTAPVHAEVREHIAENMDHPEPVDVPDILAAPVEEPVEEPVAEEPVEEEPVFKKTTPSGRPFSNIEAMQSARTAPPKDEANFWKMPDELTIDEEQVDQQFTEPIYGSHRWFEEKPEPDPDFEEPVFGSHRFVPQPEPVEEEETLADVVIEQVEPEPIVIEPAEEDNALPEHFSTIRTTSSGAELLGMYAAAKSAGSGDNLSAQAAFVRKPELGGRKTLPPEMFADPTTEPEYYEGPVYFEEAESGYEPEPEPMIQDPAFVTEAIPKILSVPEEAFAEEEPAAEFEEFKAAPEFEMMPGEMSEAEQAINEFDQEPETEFIPAKEVKEILKEEEIADFDIDDAGSKLMDELFAEEPVEEVKPQESEVVFLQDVTEEPKEEPSLEDAIEEAAGELEFEEAAEEAAEEPVEEVIPDLAAHVAEVMDEEEEDRPSPFMFSVMPHESIEEKVPEIVKVQEPEAPETAAEEPVAEIDPELEAALDEELEAFEKDLLDFDEAEGEGEPHEFEKAVEELELVNYPEAMQREEPENYVEVLKPIADTGLIEDMFEEEHAEEVPEEEALEEPTEEVLETPEELAAEAETEEAVETPQEIVVEEAIEEVIEEPEEVEPEAEPSVFIPLNQLAEERGKVITPVTEKSIAAAEIDAEAEAVSAELEEEVFEEEPEFEEPYEEEPAFEEEQEEAGSEFAGAVQDFALGHKEEADWTAEYAASELQVDEAPIEEITTPIPKDEVEGILEESEANLEASVAQTMADIDIPAEEPVAAEPEVVEPEEELSDFEKAMRAFEASNNAVPEEEFTPDELDEAMEEFIDEGVEPWAEPEFGMPDFEDSEFAKPAYLGNDFDTSEEYHAEAVMEEAEAKEEEELSGFEKALAAFEREQQEAKIVPHLEEPEFEAVPEAEPFATEPVIEEPTPQVQEAAPAPVFDAPKVAAPIPTASKAAYELPDDLREELSEFLLIDGMEGRICNTIGSIIERKREGDPTGGHMIITGDAKSGKTYLTISIIKAVGKEIGSSTGRVAKVKADALNGKDMNKVFGKVAGSDLIIENAGYLNDETVKKLIEAMKTSGTSSMVVLEGNELGIDNILTKHPELSGVFHTRLNLNELSLSQWADLACDYAKSKGYKVGDMALLALHAKIDEMNLPTTRLVVEDVQGIIDKAIEKAKKRSSGRLFGGKKNKGNSKELDETDFM